MILKSIEFVNFMSANHFEKNPVGFYVLGYPVLPNVPFNYVYISFTWLPFTLWSLFLIWDFLTANKIIQFNKAAITGLFYETENEPSSASDFKLLCDQMIILCVTITTVVTFLYRYPQYAASQMVWNTVLWSIYVLLIPAVIMSIFGGYFLNYIKGDSSSNSNALNIIFDFANLFGFIKRFLIQIVRYILITVKIGLFLIFMEKGFVVKRRMAILNENYNIPTSTFDAIWDLFWYAIREFVHVLVELANVFIVYYSQLGAFVIILYWLLNSLFSSSWPIIKLLWIKK